MATISCRLCRLCIGLFFIIILSNLDIRVLSGLFDQVIHSSENVDIVGLFKHLHPKVIILYIVISYKRI